MSNPTPVQLTPPPDFQAIVNGYLEAFEARDVGRCLSFFADDASIDFQSTMYRGREPIAEWHKERFVANLRVIRVQGVKSYSDTVVVDVVVSSNRLAAWKIKTLNGQITLRFEAEKVKEAKFAARMTNLFDLVRSGE